MIWLGNNTKLMGTAGIVPISVGVPTADGIEYGPTGGKVFYDKLSYSDGWRYLEAAPRDQSTGIKWSNILFLASLSFPTLPREFSPRRQERMPHIAIRCAAYDVGLLKQTESDSIKNLVQRARCHGTASNPFPILLG